MWKWHCPSNPQLIWEYHSRDAALEMLANHVGGYPRAHTIPELLDKLDGAFNRPPCDLIHEVVDDGASCRVPNCRIPYRRLSDVK